MALIKVRKTVIQRLTITGPMSEYDSTLRKYCDNDTQIVRGGPKPIGKTMVDLEQFQLILDRKIS